MKKIKWAKRFGQITTTSDGVVWLCLGRWSKLSETTEPHCPECPCNLFDTDGDFICWHGYNVKDSQGK